MRKNFSDLISMMSGPTLGLPSGQWTIGDDYDMEGPAQLIRCDAGAVNIKVDAPLRYNLS